MSIKDKYGKNNEHVEIKGFGIGFGQIDTTGEERRATYIITKETVDEDNEVILIDGVDFSSIKSGKRTNVWRDHIHTVSVAKIETIEKRNNEIISQIVFPPRPEDLNFTEKWEADKAWADAKVPFLSASIDFISTERRLPTKKDKEMFGEDVELIHSKIKLLGFSLTSLPAQQDAQLIAIKALDDGKITEEELNLIGIDYKKEEVTEAVVEEVIEEPTEEVTEPIEAVEEATEEVVETVEEVIETVEEVIETVEEPVAEVIEEEDEKEEVVELDVKAEAEKILKQIKQKRVRKPYNILVKTKPEIVKQQLFHAMAKKLAKTTGKIFID